MSYVKRSHRDRPATWEDLDDVPEGFVGEVVGGVVMMSPRPNPPHAHVATALTSVLHGAFGGVGGPDGPNGGAGWIILFEPRIAFREEIRVPDIAGWRRERYAGKQAAGPIRIAPDWLCEILSPSTADIDRGVKMDLYHRAGVAHLWLVDPDTRALEVYRRHELGWLRIAAHVGNVTPAVEPFEAVALDLPRLWADLPDRVVEEE